jgi:hypothetical protein
MGLGLMGSFSSHDKISKSIFSKWKDDEGPKYVSPGPEAPLTADMISPEVKKNIIAKWKAAGMIPSGLPNPDPNNYTIVKTSMIMNFLIIKIKYHDCINYEGNKILVFENCTLKDLQEQKLIDPHFSENKKYHSPIARFEPTDGGWRMASHFALHFNKII